ncbi:MAG: hypothetical protein ACD_77C00501G0002 [uncultured bacterium]|nr:MAG: hypothetical protein ACD_77C00501G0002 [uncultured bacterium]
MLPVEAAVFLERSIFVFSNVICFSSTLPVTVADERSLLLKERAIGFSIFKFELSIEYFSL